MKTKNAIVEEITLKTLSSCMLASAASSSIAIFMSCALAAILFPEKLSLHLSTGIGMALLSTCIFNIIFPLFSSYRGAIGLPTASITCVLSLMATSIMDELGRQTADDVVFYTFWAALILSGLTLGICFFLLGYYRLGNLLRYLPYPVIGGFMTAISLILIQTTLHMLCSKKIGFFDLFYSENILGYLPSVLGAIALLECTKYSNKSYLIGVFLLAATAFFYLVTSPFYSIDELYAKKMLLGPFPDSQLWQPLSLDLIFKCDFSALIHEFPKVIFLLITALIPLLLTENYLEQSFHEDIHFLHDLIYAGIGNFVCLLGGGLPAMPSKTLCSLTAEMKASSRLVGLLTALISACFLSFAADQLSLLPKSVLGILLFYLSFKNLSHWLYDVSWKDLSVISLIMFSFSFWGVFEGLLVSGLCTVFLMLFHQNQNKIIKHCLSGEHYRSYVERPEHLRSLLRERAKSLFIIKLHGYLFFASSTRILDKIQQRLRSEHPLRYLIIDFSELEKIDSTATNSILKVVHLSKEHKFSLIISNLSEDHQKVLQKENLHDIHYFYKLNDALEWSENQLLKEQDSFETLHDQLKRISNKKISALMQHFEKLNLKEGQILIEQGDASNDVYFIESGEVSVQIRLSDGKSILLRKIEPGSVVGEVALYSQTPRSAAVITEKPSIVYKMTRDKLEEIKEQDPQSAALFHEYIAWILAERLTDTNHLLRSLLE